MKEGIMARVLVVTSGKGGVGKTTSTAALGAALAQAGEMVAVVDFDVGLRNLDLVMGAERRVVFDLINVIQGMAKLPQALIRDKRLETLWLLPASQTRDKDALTEEGVGRVIAELTERFECRHPCHPQQPAERAGTSLYRGGAAAPRGRCLDDDSAPEKRAARQAFRTEGRMNLFNLFRRGGSAPVARERLQILLAHERK